MKNCWYIVIDLDYTIWGVGRTRKSSVRDAAGEIGLQKDLYPSWVVGELSVEDGRWRKIFIPKTAEVVGEFAIFPATTLLITRVMSNDADTNFRIGGLEDGQACHVDEIICGRS